MASISGISAKSVRRFVGHEGVAYQGNLYLGKKKIGFWSQDGNGGIVDDFCLDRGYSVRKLNTLVSAAYPEKGIHGEREDGSTYTIPYNLTNLMADWLLLQEKERMYKAALRKGFDVLVIASDRIFQTGMQYTNRFYRAMTEEEKAEDVEKMKEGLGNTPDITIEVFQSLEDFNIGEPIELEDIRSDRQEKSIA